MHIARRLRYISPRASRFSPSSRSTISQPTCTISTTLAERPQLGLARHSLHSSSPAQISTPGVGWSYLAAHPDESKPLLPYKIGAQFTARACDLSDALVTHPKNATGQTADEMQKIHPLKMCLRHLPSTYASPDADAIRFQIVGHVRIRDGCPSQISKVKIRQGPAGQREIEFLRKSTSTGITAKLYDPLYMDLNDHMDPFMHADFSFAQESLIYEQMKPLWGSVVPFFLGSFTVEVPIPDQNDKTRLVNMILYEYIPGITLVDIIPEVSKWKQNQRMEIMKQIILAENSLRQVGIEQSDLMPRNIIVTPSNDQTGDRLRIRLIDFDYAFCTDDSESDVESASESEPPSSIFERWSSHEDFANNHQLGWLVDWPWEDWLRREFSD